MKITIEFDIHDALRLLRRALVPLTLLAITIPIYVHAGQVGALIGFSPAQTIRAAELNQNFATLRTAVDDNHARIGDLAGLQTSARTTLVSAVNEVRLRIYGDGSAGAKVVSANATLSDRNTQYTDFTVNAGVTLTIPSGHVLRCTGTFTNNGAIVVSVGARGGEFRGSGGQGELMLGYRGSQPGLGSDQAGWGVLGDSSTFRSGGQGARAIPSAWAVRYPGPYAGGGGAGAILGAAGSGGGSLVVLAGAGIVNAGSGSIRANGSSAVLGCGGGAVGS